jgi:hypothetical protein
MPGPDGLLTVCLDYDGTLVENHVSPPAWRPDAKAFVLGAAAAGIKLVLHSCRLTSMPFPPEPWDAEDFWRTGRPSDDMVTNWRMEEEMRTFLEAEGVWLLLTPWTGSGKPIADVYVDDRGERPNWVVVAGELGVRLVHADQGGAAPLGGQGSVVALAAASPAAATPAAPSSPEPAGAAPGLGLRP